MCGGVVVRCELEVGDSHNFPPIRRPLQLLTRTRGTKSRLTGLPETRGGRAGSTRFGSFPISPGIPSHRFTVSCLSAPQSTDFHGCITSRFRELCPLRRIHLLRPSDTALITEISHRSHQEFMSPFRVPSLSGRESRAVYLAPHFPGDRSIPSPPGHSSGRNPHISDLVEAAWA